MRSQDDESPEMIQRRELLRRAAWLLGGAISAPAALAFLQGCAKQDAGESTAWKPQLLNGNEVAIITVIADRIIPKTETSGALDAGVPQFIDSALAALYAKPDQDRFRSGLAEFDAAVRAAGEPFLEREAAAQTSIVRTSLETALSGAQEPKPFILMVRELTLLGFFSSRVGITENMEYVPVPTAFHGCVPLSQMKKHVYWE